MSKEKKVYIWRLFYPRDAALGDWLFTSESKAVAFYNEHLKPKNKPSIKKAEDLYSTEAYSGLFIERKNVR